MRGLIPFGGLSITGGATTLALTTTAAQLISWSGAGGANSDDDTYSAGGDPAVRPDYANNRILVNTPGTYKVEVTIYGTLATGTALLLAQIFKNGVAVAKARQKAYGETTAGVQISLLAIVVVNKSDAPGTIATFADPASGELIGAGKAPQTMCPLDVRLFVSTSTDTLTIVEAQFNVFRIG
jgi:hypothetical protein